LMYRTYYFAVFTQDDHWIPAINCHELNEKGMNDNTACNTCPTSLHDLIKMRVPANFPYNIRPATSLWNDCLGNKSTTYAEYTHSFLFIMLARHTECRIRYVWPGEIVQCERHYGSTSPKFQ
jgi:hypothetical protein